MIPKKYIKGVDIPKDLKWSKVDWADWYVTIEKFKRRLLKRHGINIEKEKEND